MTSSEQQTNTPNAQLERLVNLLGTYATSVLAGRLLDEATAGEITPAQHDALVFIQRHGGCSAKALSEGLRISIPSSTRLVDRLVRKGLVDRRENGQDRRLVTISVTPTGESVLQTVREAHIARLQRTLQTLHPDESTQLLDLLERFFVAALYDLGTIEACCRHCGTEHDRACVVNEAHITLVGRPIAHP